MILGHVVGTVWATRKDPRLDRLKLLLVQPRFVYAPPHDVEQLVAVDLVQAGVGDEVVVCLGAPARWSLGGVNLPVDAAIMGIVDRMQLSRDAFSSSPPGSSTTGLRAQPLRFVGAAPTCVEWS